MPPSVKSGKLLLIIVFFIIPLILALGRIIYVKIDQENVRRINSKYFLPQEYVEIKIKKYFKIEFQNFCFIPSYSEWKPGELDEIKTQIGIANIGKIPSYVTDEGEWGVILIDNKNKNNVIIFSRGIEYPKHEIIRKINKKWDSSLACLSLDKNDNDLVIKFEKINQSYTVTDIFVEKRKV